MDEMPVFVGQRSSRDPAVMRAKVTGGLVPRELRHAFSAARRERFAERVIRPELPDRAGDGCGFVRIKHDGRIARLARQGGDVRACRGRAREEGIVQRTAGRLEERGDDNGAAQAVQDKPDAGYHW